MTRKVISLLSLISVLVACGKVESTPVPTEIVQVTNTAVPPTVTSTSLPTATHTATPTTLPTITPLPTATATETPTPSPTVPIWVRAGTAVPQPRAVIAPDNATQVTELARWGRGVINDVAYSLDGQQIEVKTSTGIYLHSASELVISEFLQQPFPLDAVVAPDGVTIAIRGEDSLVQIQIISDGTSGVTLMNSVRVEPAQFSADSQFLITRADYTAQLWQVDEGIQLFAGQAIAFSLDGSLVAVSEDNVVTVYQLPTMQAIATVIPTETTTEEDESKYDYSRDVRALAFSPDGSQLAVGMNPSGYVVVQGSAVELFRLSDGELLLQMNSIGAVDLPKVFDCNEIYLADPPPPTAVREINFAADGQYMAVSFGEIENGQIRLYSIPDGAVIHTFPPDIQSLAFAPDEPTLVTGSRHGLLQLWQASNGDLLETVAGYGSPIERLVFSPEGKLVAQQTAQDVSLYASENGQLLAQYPTATALTFLSDDNEVIVGYENGLIEWRSLPENNMIYQAYGHDGTVTALAFVLDNDVVVSAGEDCKMQIWNDGELMGILSPYQAESIFDAPDSPVGVATLFSVPGGTTIAGLFSGFPVDYREHGKLGFWDIGDGELLAVPDELPDNFEIAAFSPDGRHVAIYDSVDALSIWQFDDHFQFQRQWQQEIFYLSYLAFSSDGKLLIADQWSFDVETGREQSQLPLPNHLTFLVFSPDGRFLATGSSDGTVRLWGIP